MVYNPISIDTKFPRHVNTGYENLTKQKDFLFVSENRAVDVDIKLFRGPSITFVRVSKYCAIY